MFALNGAPDIIMVHAGRFIGWEIKSERGKQSESQKAFEMRVKEAGGFYFLVRSIEDVENCLEEIF